MKRTVILILTLFSGACLAPQRAAAPPRVQVVDQLSRTPSTGSRDPRLEETSPQSMGGSRLALQDLYNRANDERDSYLIELEHQTRALEIAAGRQRDLEQQHRELQQAFALLEVERAATQDRREQLIEGLVTARIRRLEAESAWLLGSLEHEFALPAEAQSASAHIDAPTEDPR